MNVMTDSFPERSTMVLKVASVSKPGTLKARLIHICACIVYCVVCVVFVIGNLFSDYF